EWASTIHSGYPDHPIFAPARRWSVNADISKAESPDLAAYLIAEANSLLQMANLLGKTAEIATIQARLDVLLKQLEALWDKTTERYRYRDRDTHLTQAGKTLFSGKADQPFTTSTSLESPDRLILRVVGGKEHIPQVTAYIEGLDAKGQAISEKLERFVWHYGLGSTVSGRVYSVVNSVRFQGISRVYSVEVITPDLTRHNQTLFLPLWAGAGSVSKRRASVMVKQIGDATRYWRAFGMPVCPADDPAFAPDNDGGSGGVWLLWNTLLAESLVEQGWPKAAFALFTRILDAQIRALKHYRGFRGAYNSETGDGLGDLDEVSGIVPLQLVMKLIGLRIVNSRRVWAGGKQLFPGKVQVTQFGVSVTRNSSGTHVHFPSGYEATVGSEWQLIEDPTPVPVEKPQAPVQSDLAANPVSANEAVPNSPGTSSVIRVDAKKDDTLEIPITRIDFGESGENPAGPPDLGAAPGTVKIPVKGPKDS
ncbi:MAG TPA: hypothetical protein VKQ72_09515, partial [Aggregatilineales bacterium]|nr:hypothetical protein [Aggregatilineales bacterium]